MYDDIVNRRDIEDRIDELESERTDFLDNTCAEAKLDELDDGYDELREESTAIWEKQTDEGREWRTLTDVLEEMGDADYLVSERYFPKYIKETLEDCGDIPRNFPWYIEIDWDATAENVKSDYSELEWDGHTYLYRD